MEKLTFEQYRQMLDKASDLADEALNIGDMAMHHKYFTIALRILKAMTNTKIFFRQ